MARRRVTESAADFAPAVKRRPEAAAFAAIAARTQSFRPAREVLRRVRAVPTIFPDLDRATRVGGWPIERVTVVHGPSSHGKTIFCQGLGLSFLKRGHMFCYVDAELTTPITWLEQLFGEYADDPRFVASRPKSYEQAVDDVRMICKGLVEAREKKKIPAETSCLFVVDSIRKLWPEDLQERIDKKGAQGKDGSIDGFGGGAGRLKAKKNAEWLDELTPLMYQSGASMLFVSREITDGNADATAKKFGKDWLMTGGRSLEFEPSLIARIERAGYVFPGGKYKEGDVAVGEKHRVVIRKTKVAAKEDKVTEALFFTSNGQQLPEGFDRARDLLSLGDDLGVVKRSGGWLSFNGKRWNGEARYVESVKPESLEWLESACRAKFADESRGVTVGGEA